MMGATTTSVRPLPVEGLYFFSKEEGQGFDNLGPTGF